MRTSLLALVFAAGCGDDGGDAGELGDPTRCGAVLGAACDATMACDLGLTCGETGRCECSAETCALACWTDRSITDVVVDGELAFAATELASGGWEVTTIPTRGATLRTAATGTGTATIAAFNGDLYIAAGTPGAFDTLITRRLPDGVNITQLKASLGDVHGLAASARGIAYSLNRQIWLVDPNGIETTLASGALENVPRALTFDGATDFYWINHGTGTTDDTVVRITGDSSTRAMLGTHEDVSSLAVCSDAINWISAVDGPVRYDRVAQVPETFAGGSATEAACTGETLFWTGRAVDVDPATAPWAIAERTGAGAPANRYIVPIDGQVFAPRQIAVDTTYVYWSLESETTARVMRLAR